MKPPVQASSRLRKGSGGRPTPEASAALGDSILDAAWRLFISGGYRQLSVDAITREAAVSKRTVYDRFGSREGLFEALVARASARWSAQAGAVYADRSREDWLEPLIGHILELMGGRDFLALSSFMLTEGQAFPQIVAVQTEMAKSSVSAFAGHFAPRIENYPSGAEGLRVAQSVLALVSGWARMLAQAGTPVDEADKSRVAGEVRAILDLYGCGAVLRDRPEGLAKDLGVLGG